MQSKYRHFVFVDFHLCQNDWYTDTVHTIPGLTRCYVNLGAEPFSAYPKAWSNWLVPVYNDSGCEARPLELTVFILILVVTCSCLVSLSCPYDCQIATRSLNKPFWTSVCIVESEVRRSLASKTPQSFDLVQGHTALPESSGYSGRDV